MNIDHANEVAIADILTQLHIQSTRTTNNKRWYLSPFRQEKTASFQLDLKTNRWHDFGEGVGGDTVNFVCAYLKANREDHTVSDALRWIKNMSGSVYQVASVLVTDAVVKDEPSLVLKTNKPVQHLGLIHYVEKRGILLGIARQHLKEIHVRNQQTGKSFFALGFPNEEKGFELRNPFFKGSLGTKSISFIRGSKPKPNAIHLFEGIFDYLSAVAHMKGTGFKADTIVLNSVSCLKQAIPYMQNYGYQVIYSWMDNDSAGEKAIAALDDFCQAQHDLVHKPMNKLYRPHKDVNAWHMDQLKLSL